ncbi:MAG: hypothetical protein Q8934_23720, partial [Bacillota bacterium]|nr:hypothetical protein [Bacillota bacterium]
RYNGEEGRNCIRNRIVSVEVNLVIILTGAFSRKDYPPVEFLIEQTGQFTLIRIKRKFVNDILVTRRRFYDIRSCYASD